MARRPEFLRHRIPETAEAVYGDVFDSGSLAQAMAGIDSAYYLVHSMAAKGEFVDKDREAAENFARAAVESGVKRIIYLGGLGRDSDLSAHLASRHEVGRILRESGVPTIELRASIVIGSGSLSFEMIRALVNRLPVMITPSWVKTRAQPIAIEDVISYLLEALTVPAKESRVFEIGGTDRASYGDIMNEYARQRGLRRVMIPVPVLTPRLSSLWLGLVTPLYAEVGRKLASSLRNETIVTDTSALDEFEVRPRGLREAIERALRNEDRELAETRWNDALASYGEPQSWGGERFGNRLVDSRSAEVIHPATAAFRPIREIGGNRGWYFADVLWKLRGFVDLLFGGPGMRRSRRDPEHLVPGDTVDFWRVEQYEPDRMLRLAAEMKLPGRAWLQFEVEPSGTGSIVRQTAMFDPHGLSGLIYWYGVYPLHRLVFSGMLRGIVNRIEPPASPKTSPGAASRESFP
jgi:uncharacterized protein YbjT (DUF2867 family)